MTEKSTNSKKLDTAAPKAAEGTAVKAAATSKKAATTGKTVVVKAEPKPKAATQPAKTKVLFAASEAQPFMASGGLADVAGALPKALCQNGIDCRVVTPLYSDIKWELRQGMKFVTNFDVDLGWRKQYCGVFESTVCGVTYYFIDNEYYFKRTGIYGFYDDAERFAFFSKAIVEMLRHIDFIPNVIHCNDWQTALVPAYLNLQYRLIEGYRDIKTVFTIHNIQYQGKYGIDIIEDILGIDLKETRILEYDKCANFMKSAIELSDRVTTVSPTYAAEIMDPWFAHGLDGFLQARGYKLSGILNGIDTDMYDPSADKMIYKTYGVSSIEDKEENKQQLLSSLALPPIEGAPLIGIVTRLVSHKGLDLVKYVFEDMVRLGVQFVVLGSGEYIYEEFFRYMQDKYNANVRFITGFIPELAHKIYAGADMFLMPSKSEPCGLAQMIAARYGTAPIVRETGGLKDTIRDFGEPDGNGFTFKTYNAHDMLAAVARAKDCYANKDAWRTLQKSAMTCDFTWDKSAKQYAELYKGI